MKKIFIDAGFENHESYQRLTHLPDGQTRFFFNNRVPATHFIEVYNHRQIGIQQTSIRKINRLDDFLEKTLLHNHRTVALFKIRKRE